MLLRAFRQGDTPRCLHEPIGYPQASACSAGSNPRPCPASRLGRGHDGDLSASSLSVTDSETEVDDDVFAVPDLGQGLGREMQP